jgi:hypothetical protein
MRFLRMGGNDGRRFSRSVNEGRFSRASAERLQTELTGACEKIELASAFDIKLNRAEKRFLYLCRGGASRFALKRIQYGAARRSRNNSHIYDRTFL